MPEHPLLAPLLRGDRRTLARAITLVESSRAADRAEIHALLAQAHAHGGGALRLGISGPPGVGKSTFIEALGLAAIAGGRRVAVLAVDPSSTLSGGSILGDKTRMEKLAAADAAFIRPTPSGGMSGGVAERTREAMQVCEAAGYDLVLVETVGVGQSETAVAQMTDLFLLLQPPNGGDDLQAIKRGVMEHADMVIVNKADLDADSARRAAWQLDAGRGDRGSARVISALTGEGIADLWRDIESLADARRASGAHASRRASQANRDAAVADPANEGTANAQKVAPGLASRRPFRILGLQQVAIGGEDRQRLRHLWVDLLGLPVTGQFTSEQENVTEDICALGEGPHGVEIDLMQPLDAQRKPAVHQTPLNHVGLWVDDLPAAMGWLAAQGLRFTPGGIRRGAAGYDVCFIHPHADEEFPLGGEGVLIELVQAPAEVISALAPARKQGP